MKNGKTIWACIFARGGSKGVPGKNIREINGKTLIQRAVESAQGTGIIDRIFVSTDDPAIRDAAIAAGAEAPFLRPAELATDDSPETLSWKHMIHHWQSELGELPDIFASVAAVCPLRAPDDITNTIDALLAGEGDIAITVTKDTTGTLFLSGELGEGNRFTFASGAKHGASRRQDYPVTHHIIASCYAASPDYIMSVDRVADGTIIGVEVPQERAIDIDTEHDFLMAKLLLEHRENNHD